MATTVVETNNKFIKFTTDINREFCRENMFSPYEGEELTSIIRVRQELKAGGEIMNIPIVARLTGAGVTTGTLVGNEERIDNYGMRLRVDWARNAITVTKAEKQKDSADLWGEAKPLLSDWGKELQRDETIAAMMALPSTVLPTASRVNGIQFDVATAAERNTWAITNNSDRVIYGAATTQATFALSLTELDTTADKFTATNLQRLKRAAMNANPKIRPWKTRDGYEFFVAFAGTGPFYDLKTDLQTVNKDARPRETMGPNGAPNNPIFQSGDEIYDGVIVRMVPEISNFVTDVWSTAGGATINLPTAGAGGTTRVEPVFLCGQQAIVKGWGQMARPTVRAEDDYGFIQGSGIEMCYGIGKIFKLHPMDGTKLVQWGMATGFYATL
jgi:hypothetical protein